jgi:hypothetical protein
MPTMHEIDFKVDGDGSQQTSGLMGALLGAGLGRILDGDNS